MQPRDRQQWILNQMRQRPLVAVDVLNSDFVVEYAEFTGAATLPQFFGAPKCPQLGRDLGNLHHQTLLTRTPIGLPAGDSSMGFPKWVYSYRL